jgi:phosphatidylinositol alpha-1,6-mannosyltransferase
MRVLVVTPDFPPGIGGIQRLMGELVARAAWESLVITLDHRNAADLGPTHRVRGVRATPKRSVALLNAAIVYKGRAWRPDAVLCGHIAVSPGATMLARLLGVPVVQYVYSKEMTHRPRLARFAVTCAASTIAISEHTARLAIRAGAPPDRVTKVEPGVDAVADEPPETRTGQPTILTVARLTDRYKGFDVMLRSLPLVRSRVSDARWVIVGDGNLRAELEADATLGGLSEAVVFAGSVTDAQRDAWFTRSHVFAMPSRIPPDGGGEGYGLVYLEAGMRGLPCVAGDAGAVAEVVVHQETGLLVSAGDHIAVAQALVSLLTNPELAMRLGRNGRKRAQARSWDRMAGEVESVIKRTVTARCAR